MTIKKQVLSVLNLGCGEDTYGTSFVDLHPSRKEVKKCNVDDEKLPFDDETFDIVYSKSLFEHLTNHKFFLNEVKRVLKIDGTLELITDNANYWVWSLSNKAHTGGYLKSNNDRHYALFTDEHLRNYCKLIGLKILRIEYLTQTDIRNFKHILRFMMDKFLQRTFFWRSGYYQMKLICQKI